MRFDLITIFPEFFAGPLSHGIVRRAQEAGLVQINIQDLREFTKDRHRTVDDRPFGGGEGMVLKPEPLFEAVESLLGQSVGDAASTQPVPEKTSIILLSAAGKRFTQAEARRLASQERVIFICGRYEGVDERVADHLATDELSIGDFVLSGGELPAALVIDAVTRLLPGALGNEASSQNESFSLTETLATNAMSSEDPSRHSPLTTHHCLLDFPHYTRPADFRGWTVPEVLVGGNHAEVAKWRRQQAIEKTRLNRPDLLMPTSTVLHAASLIAKITGHFRIQGRGAVLVYEFSSETAKFKIGSSVQLKTPSGQTFNARIRGVEHIKTLNPSTGSQWAIMLDEPWDYHLFDVGTEVWALLSPEIR